MTLLEVLRRAREKFISGEHRMKLLAPYDPVLDGPPIDGWPLTAVEVVDEAELLMHAADFDSELAANAWIALDQAAGGDGCFSVELDRGPDARVASIFGLACVHEMAREAGT
jgi:hypothetical protein